MALTNRRRGRRSRRRNSHNNSHRFGSFGVSGLWLLSIVAIFLSPAIDLAMSGLSTISVVKASTRRRRPWPRRSGLYPVAEAFVPKSQPANRLQSLRHFTNRSNLTPSRERLRSMIPSIRGFSSGSTTGPPPSTLSPLLSSTTLKLEESDDQDPTAATTAIKTSFLGSVKEQYCISRLMFLKDELIKLTGDNKEFNANSSAQRSMAIFGEVRSCTKETLQEIADTNSLPDDKKLLARYILEFQELSKLQNNKNSESSPPKQQQQKEIQQQKIEQEQQEKGDFVSPKSSHPKETIKVPPQHQPLVEEETTLIEEETIQTVVPPAVRSGNDTRKRPTRKKPSTHEEIVEGLFANPRSSKLDSYWKEPLLELSRPVARDLAKQLDPELCPMGYDPDRGKATTSTKTARGKRIGFLGYCRDQKELYPNHVILVRCGDFYETFGVDAMLLVEHVGLNPMGGKARSGCPKQNIQPTLDGLTAQGFSVAVYEEVEPVGTSSAKKLKTRSLAQIVSPASPTYLYDNWLLGDNINSGSCEGGMNDASYSLDGLPPPRPCVGVVHTAAGYSIVEVSLEERSIQYSERLTAEAVSCRLAAYPPADPLIYVPSHSEGESSSINRPSFLPNSSGNARDSGGGLHRLRTKILNPHLVPDPSPGKSDADRYIHAIVDTILRMNELHTTSNDPHLSEEDNDSSVAASLNAFTITMASTSTNPLYVETATQIGLMSDKTIPSLIRHVLDDAAPAATRRFLHRYLLIPPPPSVAQSMANVVGTLIDDTNTISLPPLTVPNLGKSLILIRAGQAGAGVYGELLQSLDTTMCVLESCVGEDNESMEAFVDALLHICQHESGLPAKRDSLLERCEDAVAAIEAVVSTSYHVEEEYESLEASMLDQVSRDDYIPVDFFERNEKSWRGRVQQNVAKDAYERVRVAAEDLSQAIREDFIGTNESNKLLIKYNFFDNIISLNKIPSEGFEKEIEFLHPNDRFGKVLSNRWTTKPVQKAVSQYVSECENATKEVASILSSLAQKLQDEGHVPAIVQSSHFNLILSTAFHHAVKATNSKWELGDTIEEILVDDDAPSGAYFVDVFPYWMHKSKAVTNTFDLSSMILLTAPNMSGKSTLMRSTAAAALLTICGLCAPLSSKSRIPRFDTLFLRGASSDIPSEDKSAFGAEMGDLAALFRCSGHKSLVFVDELGRGTSPRDGTRLAGAVLETMAESGMSGIFATHLHDVLELPLNKTRIATKRIKIDQSEENDGNINYEWTHKLEDGICTDSMALVTAERFGLPDEIISRARELTAFIPQRNTPEASASTTNEETVTTNTISRNIDSKKIPIFEDIKNNTVLEDERNDGDVDDNEVENAELSWRDLKKDFENEFNAVIDLASGLFSVDNDSGSDSTFGDDKSIEENFTSKTIVGSIQVPPRHHPPASLSNRSCIYVLQLVPQGLSLPTATNNTSAKYYVGETDSISKRLKQHRKKGGAWKASRAVIFPLGNKSMARYCESALIGAMAREGFSLESLEDGRTLRHFRD